MENFDDCWEILLVFDLQQRRPSEPPLCRYRWPIAAWRSIGSGSGLRRVPGGPSGIAGRGVLGP
jgi:hypothetical protein